MFETLSSNMRSMKGSPKELWLVYVLKFLESFAYFSMASILTIYLSKEHGLSDFEAGGIYGIFGALISLFGFTIGGLIDYLGVRGSLILGFSILTVARFCLALSTELWVVKLNLFLLMPMGNALGIPVLSLGIKRFTSTQQRGFAFGLFYTVMNVAALFANWSIDAITLPLQKGVEIGGAHWTPERLIILLGAVLTVPALVISIVCVRDVKVEDGADENDKVCESTVQKSSPWVVINELFRSSSFWRFVAITIIATNLKMLFRYLDASFPKYLVREFGEGVPKGLINSINPAIIICLVPVLTAFTSGVAPYDMIHYGSYISGFSVLPIALTTSLPAAIAFVAILSIGEAAWSPRFYDLSVSMAPEGKEGTYLALGSAPVFLAKLPVGYLSGWLLQEYCPAEGPRSSTTMWMFIWLMTMVSPIMFTVFQSCLRPRVVVPAEVEEGTETAQK